MKGEDPKVQEIKANYNTGETLQDDWFGEITLLSHKETGDVIALR